jgi:hypothetical protein
MDKSDNAARSPDLTTANRRAVVCFGFEVVLLRAKRTTSDASERLTISVAPTKRSEQEADHFPGLRNMVMQASQLPD